MPKCESNASASILKSISQMMTISPSGDTSTPTNRGVIRSLEHLVDMITRQMVNDFTT